MKRGVSIAIIFLLTILSVHGQKDIYESKKFDELSQNHEVLAIIPFLTTLDLEETLSAEKLDDLEKKEAYTVQSALETYFLKRKRKKKFSVEFQDISETNALLTKNNIGLNNLDTYTPKELSKILGVDGIISGTLVLNTLISEDVDESFSFISFLRGKTDFGRISIKISDGQTGKLLWKYSRTINRKSGRNTYAIVEAMMRKASRKFPYDREKRRKK